MQGILTDDRDDPRGHDSVCIKKLAYSNVIGCCKAKAEISCSCMRSLHTLTRTANFWVKIRERGGSTYQKSQIQVRHQEPYSTHQSAEPEVKSDAQRPTRLGTLVSIWRTTLNEPLATCIYHEKAYSTGGTKMVMPLISMRTVIKDPRNDGSRPNFY